MKKKKKSWHQLTVATDFFINGILSNTWIQTLLFILSNDLLKIVLILL